MSTSVSWNGSSFTVPATGEEDWGGATKVDGLLISLGQNALSKAGGTFTLTADADFGATAGLKALYYKSRTSNVATTGIVRLAVSDVLSFRNNANDGNLSVGVNADDQLIFNSKIVMALTSLTRGDVLYASSANTVAGLAVGAANRVLTSDGTDPSWGQVSNAMLAGIATARIKGRVSGGSGNVEDLTGTQATTLLDAFVGDSGSGGTKGLVPAPTTGDATKVLKGDGTWATADVDVTTTKGDLIGRKTASLDRIAVGQNGRALTANSSNDFGVSYIWPGGTSSAKSADYTVTDTDGIAVILMTRGASNRTITFPTAADNTDREITVVVVDSNTGNVILDGEGAETVNGAATYTMCLQYEMSRWKCNGTAWFLIARYIPNVSAIYETNAGQTITTGSSPVIDFEDVVVDTHNAVTTGASWVFTAPRAGLYNVSSFVGFADSAAWTAGEFVIFELHKNGTLHKRLDIHEIEASGTFIQAAHGSALVSLAKGDTVDVRLTQDSGSSIATINEPTRNWISITGIF